MRSFPFCSYYIFPITFLFDSHCHCLPLFFLSMFQPAGFFLFYNLLTSLSPLSLYLKSFYEWYYSFQAFFPWIHPVLLRNPLKPPTSGCHFSRPEAYECVLFIHRIKFQPYWWIINLHFQSVSSALTSTPSGIPVSDLCSLELSTVLEL